MLESKKNQPKLDPNQDKYLIINSAVVLDAIVTSRVRMEDDLVLKQLDEGIFSILKDGKQIVKYLDKLTTEHGYTTVFYSSRKEHQIIHALKELDVACKREGLKGFPKITAIFVKDREAYQNVRASDPNIVEGRSHRILVAGYSLQFQQETEILNGCSKLLYFSKLEQNSYIVLDNRSSLIEKTKEEGWNIYDTSSTSFSKILYDLCQKSSAPNNQNIQENFEEHNEEEKNAGVETNIFSPEADSTSSPSEALGSRPRNSIYSKHETEQKNIMEQPSEAIVKPTANNLGPSLDFSDTNSQKLSQMNATIEADKSEKEEVDSNELEELKDWSTNNLLASKSKFKITEGPQLRGSSPSLAWFVDEETNFKWVGKCSHSGILEKDPFYEYKEFLGGLIYKLFGVRIPKTIFSEQIVSKEVKKIPIYIASDIDKPRIHLISSFVPDFELLGDKFVERYKASSKRNKKQLFYIKGGNRPLIGFGKVVAVSILIHDYDFVGNSGKNIGCIPSENGEYFEILKIDPGESLSFAENAFNNPPTERGALVGTSKERIDFNDLNEFDKRECVKTLKEILAVKVSTLDKLFTPFIKVDKRFETIFEELLNRRKEILVAFCGEVGSLIERYIRELEEQQAAELMSKWGKSPLSLPLQRAKKGKLIKDKAQLEAFTAARDTNTTGSKILQAALSRKARFVGRETELSQIKKLFSVNTGIIGCAIVGGPGLGKSQLATEYILKNQKEMYSEVVWLHAEQSDLIVDQMQIYLETYYNPKFDTEEKDKKTAINRRFYQLLQKKEDGMNKSSKRPCIVFDNAESMTQIADYLPNKKTYPKLKIDIIVTSRYKRWKEPLGTIIEMQAFGIEETKNYIRACIPDSGLVQDGNQLSVDAEELNELVGGLPIALSLAVAYIRQKGLSISDFCNFVGNEYNKEFVPLQNKRVSEKSEADRDDKDELKSINIVSTVLTLALTDLRRKNYSVEFILNIIAYLSPDDIRINLLVECWSQCRKRDSLIDPNLNKLIGFSLENTSRQLAHENLKELSVVENSHERKSSMAGTKDFDEALELMLSYSLVSFNPANQFQNQIESDENISIGDINVKSIKVHRLTQQVIRLNHQKSGVYEKNYEIIFDWVLDKLFCDEKDLKDVKRAALLIPHGIYMESLRNTINAYKMAELQELIAGHQLYGVGNYRIAQVYYQKAFEIKEKYYGKDDPQTGITLTNLGNAWGSLGNSEKQKDLLTQALVINETYYGKDHPETGTTLANLGSAWGSLRNYEKQKDLLTRALLIKENHYGKDHPETGITLTNLGSAWGYLGNYEKQKDFLAQALVINEKQFGKDHPQTGITLTNLGNAWGSLGNYEKQKDLLTQALEIFEKHYGKDHPQTGVTLTNLGNAWEFLGNYQKKKDLLTRALVIKEKHFGKDHPSTASTLTNLGNSWGSLGDYEKQKEFLTRALVINEKHYGKDHPETGITLESLGNAWGSLGNYEKQKDLLTRALVINEKHFGKDHSETGATVASLGNAWGFLGEYEKQKDLLTRALEIFEKHYGKDHSQTGITLRSLGSAWGYLGNYEKQKDFLTRALEIFEKNYGKDHPQTGITLANLGIVWGTLGNYEKQKDLLTRALIIEEKHYGKDHPQTGIILGSLGDAWGDLGEYEKQKDLLTRALEIFEKHYGKDHSQTGITLRSLGSAWGYLGNYEKQKDFLTRALVINEKHFGKDHPETGITLTNLGSAWGYLGNYEKQKDLLTRALLINEKHYGKDHPQTGITLANLGSLWGDLGDYEKQKELLTQALEIFEKNYGKDHPETGNTLTNLASAWGCLGNYEKQKDLLTRALNIFESHYSPNHPHIHLVKANLARLSQVKNHSSQSFNSKAIKGSPLPYPSQSNKPRNEKTILSWQRLVNNYWRSEHLTQKFRNKLKKCNPLSKTKITFQMIIGNSHSFSQNYYKQTEYLIQALEICQKKNQNSHSLNLIVLFNLAVACSFLKNYDQQKVLLNQAINISQQEYGAKHPLTAFIHANLGTAFLKTKDLEESFSQQHKAYKIFEEHFGETHKFSKYSIRHLQGTFIFL